MSKERLEVSGGTQAAMTGAQASEEIADETAPVVDGPAKRVLDRRALFGLAVGIGVAPVVIGGVASSFDLNRSGVYEAARNQVRHVTPGRLAVGIELIFPWQMRVELVRDPAYFGGVQDSSFSVVSWAGGRTDLSGLDRPAGPRADRPAFDLAWPMPMVGDIRSWSVRFRPRRVDPSLARVRITAGDKLRRYALTYRNERPLTVIIEDGKDPRMG